MPANDRRDLIRRLKVKQALLLNACGGVLEEHQLRSEYEERGECLASRIGSFFLGHTERVGVGSRAGLETLLKTEISRYCQESNVCDTYPLL